MNHEDRDTSFHLVGWFLFLACAFVFVYIAMRDRDFVLGLASLFFLAGCVAFIIPLLGRGRKRRSQPPGDESSGSGRN